jgi:hypothetical protein
VIIASAATREEEQHSDTHRQDRSPTHIEILNRRFPCKGLLLVQSSAYNLICPLNATLLEATDRAADTTVGGESR